MLTICIILFTYIHHVTYVHNMSHLFIIFHPCSPYVISSLDMFTICIEKVISGKHMFNMSPLLIKCHIMFTRCHLWLCYVHQYVICVYHMSHIYIICYLKLRSDCYMSPMFILSQLCSPCHTYPTLNISSLFEIGSPCYLCTHIVISIWNMYTIWRLYSLYVTYFYYMSSQVEVCAPYVIWFRYVEHI